MVERLFLLVEVVVVEAVPPRFRRSRLVERLFRSRLCHHPDWHRARGMLVRRRDRAYDGDRYERERFLNDS